MLIVSLVISAVAGIGAAILGGPLAAVLLMGALSFAAAIGRLSFESIVQRDAPGANHGRAFAVFETRFQLAWALAAFVAVAIQVPGPMGFLIVGIACVGTLVHLLVGFGRLRDAATSSPASSPSGGTKASGSTPRRRGRATGRELRSRSASARRRPR
jgi:hypothetical protein